MGRALIALPALLVYLGAILGTLALAGYGLLTVIGWIK